MFFKAKPKPLNFIQDYNEDGKLSSSEFSELIKAFGNQVATEKVQTQGFILGFYF